MKEPALPRSVLGSLTRARETFARIRAEGHPSIGGEAERMLGDLVEQVREGAVDETLHEQLTAVIDRTAEICVAIDGAYFDPGDQVALLAQAAQSQA